MRGIFPPDPDEPRRPSRHEIALEAMKAAITGFGPMFVMGDLSPTAIATEAYELADAMLAAGNDAEPLCPNCHGHTVSHNGVPILCKDCEPPDGDKE